jgi:hypothetical protein
MDKEMDDPRAQLAGEKTPPRPGSSAKSRQKLMRLEKDTKTTLEEALKVVKAKRKKSGKWAKLQKLMGAKEGEKSGSEDGESDSSDSDFGGGLSSVGAHRKLLQTHIRTPGRLSRNGLQQMAHWVASRGGADVDPTVPLPAVAVNYLLTVWVPSRKGDLQVGQLRRMRTLATAVDLLAKGRTLAGLDFLMQRLKAEEMAQEEGSWANAQWLELLPKTEVAMTTEAERRAAGKEEKKEREREDALGRNVDPARGVRPAGQRDQELGTQQAGGDGDGPGARRDSWWARRRKKQGFKKVGNKWIKKPGA